MTRRSSAASALTGATPVAVSSTASASARRHMDRTDAIAIRVGRISQLGSAPGSLHSSRSRSMPVGQSMLAARHRCVCTAASLVALLASRAVAHAQEVPEKTNIEQYSLDDLLKTETAVASVRAVAVRETPGIVTIIKREEIVSAGARDLIDVLMLVPGFSFGVDIEGVTDVGFRGIWAHEGKMLILVDGQEMTELLFQNNALGHHYPIDQIERIEIIRGPGSALYGGFAELGVISIITRGAAELDGISASVDYGRMQNALGQADLNVAAGKESIAGIEGLNASAALLVGVGNRSDAPYSDFSGNSYDLADSSALHALF